MSGLLPVAGLRFREAVAGKMFWLLPIHFVLAYAAAKSMPGTTKEARIEAADSTALALAAGLGLVAAAVIGAGPLAEERLRPRGALLLGAPLSPVARVLGTFLGSGAALSLLVAALCASAMASVDLGAGTRSRGPALTERALSITGGEPDGREEGLVWITESRPKARVVFGRAKAGSFRAFLNAHVDCFSHIVLEARARTARDGGMPGRKKIVVRYHRDRDQDELLSAPLSGPFRLELDGGHPEFEVERVPGNFDIGLRREGAKVLFENTPPSLRAHGFIRHGVALGSGLFALMAAAISLSTFVGTGVAAAGALALATLSIFRSTFVDAAATLTSAGAMERAMEAAGGGHPHGAAQAGVPSGLAPVFRAVAAVLPDGSRFDLAQAIAANEVPDTGDVGRAVVLAAILCVLFLAVAALGARRRP